jgi:hypothetical protein
MISKSTDLLGGYIMMNLQKEILKLEKELDRCTEFKRRIFLMTTINTYSKKLGWAEPYPSFI